MGLTGKPEQELADLSPEMDVSLKEDLEAIRSTRDWIEDLLTAFKEGDNAEFIRLYNFKDAVLERLNDALGRLRKRVERAG